MKRPFWARVLAPLLFLALFSCAHTPEQGVLADDYYNLARDFHRLGEYGRAEFYYGASLDLEPKSRDSLYNLALLYLETGNGDKALDSLNRLYGLDENNLLVMNALGLAFSLREEWDEALAWYDRVLEQFPWDRTALFNSALILSEQENPSEALSRLDRLWERDKSYRTAMALWEKTGDRPAEVRREYLESAETEDEGELLDLKRRRFDFYLIQKMDEEALSLAGRLKEEDSEKGGWYWFKEGELLLKQYRIEEGLASVREAFRKGFDRSGDVAALADQLAPSYRDAVLEMEKLYFPADEGNVN